MYKNTFYFFRMNDEINPWAIHNVEDFLYFCCPECEEKNQSKDLFIKHAINEHPKSKTTIGYEFCGCGMNETLILRLREKVEYEK